jgi:E3 ubiquitin-protein ligase TRIP12
LQLVDVELAKSLAQIQALAMEQNAIPKDKVFIIRSYMEFAVQRFSKLSQKVARIERTTIEDLALDFTIPGYDIELRVKLPIRNTLCMH